jgi:mycobactin polyketide synthetase MbtD
MLGGITVTELIEALRAASTGGPAAPPSFERAGTANGAHHSTLAMLERLDS